MTTPAPSVPCPEADGIEIVLVNSNPATIMTDNAMADHIYIEPLTLPTIKRIIEKEKPDSILSGFGGQTGLTLSMQLAKEGFLKEHNVRLLGASPETIDKAEDRQMFKDTMESIGQPCIPSKVVTTVEDALEFAEEITYPVIIRPAFTLGGTGGGIVDNREELMEVAANGLALSPITQILVEKSIAGWKEIEFEVIATARATSSRSAPWKTSTRSASTPATASSSRRRSRFPIKNIRCSAPRPSTSSTRSA